MIIIYPEHACLIDRQFQLWFKKQQIRLSVVLKSIIIYLKSECIEKCQFELCSKYYREYDFDVILGQVASSHKLRWICRRCSNGVAPQVEIPGKSTFFVAQQIRFVARHNFHVVSEVTLHYYCKTLRYYKRRIFSLISREVLRHAATFAALVKFFIKHLFHEYLCPYTF